MFFYYMVFLLFDSIVVGGHIMQTTIDIIRHVLKDYRHGNTYLRPEGAIDDTIFTRRPAHAPQRALSVITPATTAWYSRPERSRRRAFSGNTSHHPPQKNDDWLANHSTPRDHRHKRSADDGTWGPTVMTPTPKLRYRRHQIGDDGRRAQGRQFWAKNGDDDGAA